MVSGFGNNHVQPVLIDDDRWMWVGTETNGYYLYDMESGRDKEMQQWLSSSSVNAIVKSDYDSKYYIAGTIGIYRIDHIDATPVLENDVTMIKHMLADQHYLWIATYSRGLIRYDLKSKETLILNIDNSVIGSNIVRCVHADRDGRLWVATDKGLFTIDERSKSEEMPIVEAVMPEYTSSHYVIPIYESRAGDIWYGTLGSGLHRLIRNKDGEGFSAEAYDTTNLLPSNIINAMVEDDEGRLWVTTNREICVLDLDASTSTIYNMGNGLTNIGFHDVSYAHHSDGRIIFGGTLGVTILNPKEIKVDSIPVTPCFTDLKIWGESILFDSEPIERVSDRAIECTELVTLSHDQNSFSFSVSGFNYTGVKSQSYSYRLYGFDREWRTLESNRREISYTNIPHGRYRLAVVGCNGDGIQSPFKRSVEIVIDPPLWLTWYAYLFYVVLIISGAGFTMLYYKRVLERENAVRMARMEKSKVEELLNYRSRFITNVSHEFRTPLTLIISPLQRLMSDSRADEIPEWRECFETMQHNANRLLYLSGEFLNYQKRDNKELKLKLKYDRLDQLVERLSTHFYHLGESRGVNVEYHSDSVPIYLHYDEEYIEQIIYNLVSNGVKYTHKGGEVVISLKGDEQSVVLTVSDNGAGISPEVRSKIFDRFASYDSNLADSSVSGIGIGLSLTRELVVLHGGKISFESVEGVGTTFTVVFYNTSDDDVVVDLPEEESVQPPIEELVVDSRDLRHDDSKGVMLVVDDNAQICRLLVSLFEGDGGYSVLTAGNGAEGLELAKRFIPDIIVTDVMMPIMDGLELCERIKTEATTSHIPVVMLTAKSADSDVARGYEYRADGYCTKPFDNDVLQSLVNSILVNRAVLAQRVKNSETPAFEVDGCVTTRQDKVLLGRLSEYIESQIGNAELKVSDLCSEVGLTQVVLNKKLRSLIDMTANQLIRQIRIKRAATLLRTGRYTVSSITYDMGFNDLRHFRESFKKEYGVFPQEYKRQFTGSNDTKKDVE